MEYVTLNRFYYVCNNHLIGNCEWRSNYSFDFMIFENYNGKGFIQYSLSNLEF